MYMSLLLHYKNISTVTLSQRDETVRGRCLFQALLAEHESCCGPLRSLGNCRALHTSGKNGQQTYFMQLVGDGGSWAFAVPNPIKFNTRESPQSKNELLERIKSRTCGY